jgi:hypothetical protein
MQAIRESYSENSQRHIEERGLLNASQFGLRIRRSKTRHGPRQITFQQ